MLHWLPLSMLHWLPHYMLRWLPHYMSPTFHALLAPTLHAPLAPTLHAPLAPTLHAMLVPTFYAPLATTLHALLAPTFHALLAPTLHAPLNLSLCFFLLTYTTFNHNDFSFLFFDVIRAYLLWDHKHPLFLYYTLCFLFYDVTTMCRWYLYTTAMSYNRPVQLQKTKTVRLMNDIRPR